MKKRNQIFVVLCCVVLFASARYVNEDWDWTCNCSLAFEKCLKCVMQMSILLLGRSNIIGYLGELVLVRDMLTLIRLFLKVVCLLFFFVLVSKLSFYLCCQLNWFNWDFGVNERLLRPKPIQCVLHKMALRLCFYLHNFVLCGTMWE